MEKEQEEWLRAELAAARKDPESVEASILDAVPYHYAGRGLDIEAVTEEFTHICPMTGLPDFGRLEIRYRPRSSIVELKSLKYYLVQYRQVGIFYEHVVHRILDDLVAVVDPVEMSVAYATRSRGGIESLVTARWPDEAPR